MERDRKKNLKIGKLAINWCCWDQSWLKLVKMQPMSMDTQEHRGMSI